MRQRGVALITVLGLMAVSLLLISSILLHQHTQLQHQFSYERRIQAEELAKIVMSEVLLAIRQLPHATQLSEYDLATLNIDKNKIPDTGFTWQLDVSDAQGYLNLNDLSLAPDHSMIAHLFENKLAGVDRADRHQLADWMDQDDTPRVQGNEFQFYHAAGLKPANRDLIHCSEALQVTQWDIETWRQMQDYVRCLPKGTPLNINSANVSVLSLLFPNTNAEQIRAQRDSLGGYKTVAELLSNPIVAGSPPLSGALSVTTQYIEITLIISDSDDTEDRWQRPNLWFYSLINIEQGRFKVIQRIRPDVGII